MKIAVILLSLVFVTTASAQSNAPIDAPKKANARATTEVTTADPFDGASVEKMGAQYVTLDTELGAIEIAMMPENAPESVRNFLNLSATGSLDTTTFSRVVKGFVIQGVIFRPVRSGGRSLRRE